MTKRSTALITTSLAALLAHFAPMPVARADIFQWEYTNPADPALGKQQSTMLAPGGAGVNAAPDANLSGRNLTMAYLIGANLSGANMRLANLTNAELSEAILTDASFGGHFDVYSNLTGANFTNAKVRATDFGLSNLTTAQLYSTASYQAQDLTSINLSYLNLTGANFAGQNLTNAGFGVTTLTSANFTQANLTDASFSQATLTGANLSQANLSNSNFGSATLTGANLTGAEVRGAWFSGTFSGTEITAAQLYSTASYQAHDLTGIVLSLINLDGINLAGQNLTNANVGLATLSNANFSDANLTNADFSYWTDLTGANLSHANLKNANFAGLDWCNDLSCGTYPGTNLTNANLSGADARAADFYAAPLAGANLSNMIGPNGHIAGLNLTAGASLAVRDYENYAGVGIPIVVDQHLAMDATGALRLVFDADPWNSSISFAPGIPVALAGTLDLTFAPGVDVATQSGRTIDLFDWTGVTPTGAFTISSPYTWNLSKLYTTGEVTLTAVPSLPGDFNHDGSVDAADYVVWRKNPGGIYTQNDYSTWRAHFGQTLASGAGATVNAVVPESTTLVLVIVGSLAMFSQQRIRAARISRLCPMHYTR